MADAHGGAARGRFGHRVVPTLARLAWAVVHGKQQDPSPEAQARENAGPLTTAILGSQRRAKARDRDWTLPASGSMAR
jgi:hypothetical protein